MDTGPSKSFIDKMKSIQKDKVHSKDKDKKSKKKGLMNKFGK